MKGFSVMLEKDVNVSACIICTINDFTLLGIGGGSECGRGGG